MALTILGGLAKGQTLKVPPGDMIRPMSVLLKRKIFDSRQNLEGYRFVDLCAGSGAVGLESWSRGADEVYFTEINKKVAKLTQENLKKIQASYREENPTFHFQNRDCLSWLKTSFEEIYLTNSNSDTQKENWFVDHMHVYHFDS